MVSFLLITLMPIFHPLHTDLPLPNRMNNPFDYTPHPLCRMAAEEVCGILSGEQSGFPIEAREEIKQGKMFGVLIVTRDGKQGEEVGYLCAYSGQIGGRADWPGFVPAVYDYLRPDDYFKTHEAEITNINEAILRMESDERIARAKELTEKMKAARQQVIEEYRAKMKTAKEARDRKRASGKLSTKEEALLIKESQFMKAELRRLKQSVTPLTPLEEQVEAWQEDLTRLRRLRKQLSDTLQQWLFSQFRMVNYRGEEKDLLEIFASTAMKIPPAGSGECCEPRLLQYAFRHGMRPRQMAMFWWGESPKEEIRHHRCYYPACQGKCKPILQWMLPTETFAATAKTVEENLAICYEDDQLAIINKPSGLLSVPGKDTTDSVYTLMHQRYPFATCPLIVHRLDMDTSGVMVIARTEYAFQQLRAQFEIHQVRKRYVALVCPRDNNSPLLHQSQGDISLPLNPDYLDRPRQKVDTTNGKSALTHYKVLHRDPYTGIIRLALYPQTGRTHQIRVHCAHPQGLNAPILGDPLYGDKQASRLMLHAERITLTHPTNKEECTWQVDVPF